MVKVSYVIKKIASVILRVPSLFIVEIWYRTDPISIHQQWHPQSTEFVNMVKENIPDMKSYMPNVKEFEPYVRRMKELEIEKELEKTQLLLIHLLYYIAVIFAAALMVMPLKRLVTLYMYIISAGLLLSAHCLSSFYVKQEQQSLTSESVLEDASNIHRVGLNLALQFTIGAFIAYIINVKHWKRIPLLAYSLPVMARLCTYPPEHLHRIHNLASLITILIITFFIFNAIPMVLDHVKNVFQRIHLAIQVYGYLTVLMAAWWRLMLPAQFLVFWVALLVRELWRYRTALTEGSLVVLLAAFAECCGTPVSMVAMCVVISYTSSAVLSLTRYFLQAGDTATVHQGATEGFTMLLLALQTGLTDLSTHHRAFLMGVVLFIVLASLIQSVYEVTEPVLLTLGASHSRRWTKHAKVVLLCTCLWVFPLYMSRFIMRWLDLDFWLLVVVSSCLLTSVQVLGSLAVYGLFMYEVFVRSSPWPALDDVVYWTKAATRTAEFSVAVLVVLYGVTESVRGDWSWINAGILLIHAYFNVWQRLQTGWRVFLQRRTAVAKINSLPLATDAELSARSDEVCSICYHALSPSGSVHITACRHFFHGACLRKWLYIEDTCPLCHQKVSQEEAAAREDTVPDFQDADDGVVPDAHMAAEAAAAGGDNHNVGR